jgi:hypothetical protein
LTDINLINIGVKRMDGRSIEVAARKEKKKNLI